MRLETLFERCKCISFDIFDTLVNRDVARPGDIFKICEREYGRRYGSSGIDGFSAAREECERRLRKSQGREVTLCQIYAEIEKMSDGDVAGRYRELEVQAEIDLSAANPRGRRIYERARRTGKRIIITTDMYLDRDAIEKILWKNGYGGYGAIYLSSELGLTKNKGDIYPFILEREGIGPSELLHIGDNPKSDILRARMNGIRAWRIGDSGRRWSAGAAGRKGGNAIFSGAMESFLENRKPLFSGAEERAAGYACLGPMLYGFLEWVDAQCALEGVERILFFSRDGYLMEKMYKRMRRRCNAEFSYFYASRRALQVASLHIDPSYDAMVDAMAFPRVADVAWLLNSWGLDASRHHREIERARLSPTSEIRREEIPGHSGLRELFGLLRDDIVENSKRECGAFLSYLREEGCAGRVAIVDIGWNGTMQRAFERIAGHFHLDVAVTGFYLGIVPSAKNQLEYDMRGYLFQKGKNEDLFLRCRYITCMMEAFLVAPHGSLRRYRAEGDGTAGVELEEFEYQGSALYGTIRELQGAAMAFADDFSEKSGYFSNSEIAYSENIMEHFLRPRARVVDFWRGFQMWDGKWVDFVKCGDGGRLRYLFHPRRFIEDFISSSWKIGFLKYVFRLPLPYDKWLVLVRKIYE